MNQTQNKTTEERAEGLHGRIGRSWSNPEEVRNEIELALEDLRTATIRECIEALGEEKSLLGDMAYSGGDYTKKYVEFQRNKDLHYNSFNSSLTKAKSNLEALIKE